MPRLCSALLLFLLLALRAAPAADLGWQPERTWLFVVGLLEWKDSDTFGSFPAEFRRDAEMVELFKQKGVPPSQIVYLQDKQATQRRIESTFVAQLKKVPPGDLLVIYYAGHGYKADDGKDVLLAPYDAGDDGAPGWSVKSIPRTIEKYSAASRVLWLIDCCYSGRAAMEINWHVSGGPAYLCVTSSLASQSSTGHWTFTEAFLDALRGAPYVDLDHDGRVTFDEFARHASLDMNLAEEQQSAYGISGDFDSRATLALAPALKNPRIGERLKALSEGDWYVARVIDTKDSQLKIHYIGYGADEDTWVDPADTRPIKAKQYPVGAHVEVRWKKTWYPATIRKVNGSVHYIHYTGYEDDWDEWVSSNRIRTPKEE